MIVVQLIMYLGIFMCDYVVVVICVNVITVLMHTRCRITIASGAFCVYCVVCMIELLGALFKCLCFCALFKLFNIMFVIMLLYLFCCVITFTVCLHVHTIPGLYLCHCVYWFTRLRHLHCLFIVFGALKFCVFDIIFIVFVHDV